MSKGLYQLYLDGCAASRELGIIEGTDPFSPQWHEAVTRTSAALRAFDEYVLSNVLLRNVSFSNGSEPMASGMPSGALHVDHVGTFPVNVGTDTTLMPATANIDVGEAYRNEEII